MPVIRFPIPYVPEGRKPRIGFCVVDVRQVAPSEAPPAVRVGDRTWLAHEGRLLAPVPSTSDKKRAATMSSWQPSLARTAEDARYLGTIDNPFLRPNDVAVGQVARMAVDSEDMSDGLIGSAAWRSISGMAAATVMVGDTFYRLDTGPTFGVYTDGAMNIAIWQRVQPPSNLHEATSRYSYRQIDEARALYPDLDLTFDDEGDLKVLAEIDDGYDPFDHGVEYAALYSLFVTRVTRLDTLEPRQREALLEMRRDLHARFPHETALHLAVSEGGNPRKRWQIAPPAGDLFRAVGTFFPGGAAFGRDHDELSRRAAIRGHGLDHDTDTDLAIASAFT
jgi:hypothetical protein